MKKFFITYKDGSNQTLMPVMHDTCKKAEEALMAYVHYHNKRSDCFLSVAIKEDEVSEILDFDIAKQVVGSSEFVLARESLRFSDVELNVKHIGALIALNKLFTIAQAWNKQDNFVPDFANHKQAKWYPFFECCKGGMLRLWLMRSVWVLVSVSRIGGELSNSGNSSSIYTIKFFCYEVQDNGRNPQARGSYTA